MSFILDHVIQAGLTITATVGLFVWILHKYLNSYLGEKGAIRALIEDIQKTTRLEQTALQEFVERNAYLAEKGKQAATKEDIEQITRLIESVKAEHSTLLELWKLELSKRGTIHRLRIEKEFETLSRAWDALAELRFATAQLFPHGLQPRVEGDRRSQAEKRANAFYQAYDDYMNAIYKNKIFFPEDLCKLLFEILQQVKQVEIHFRHGIDADTGSIPPQVYVQVEDVLTGFLGLVEDASLRINKQSLISDSHYRSDAASTGTLHSKRHRF